MTSNIVKEPQIEYGFVGKLTDLKYSYRSDIRNRIALEQNFRKKFEALNCVNLSDPEFARLRDEIINPDVFQASKLLRQRNTFIREDGTPLQYTLVNIKDWCKNEFEVINQLLLNNQNHLNDEKDKFDSEHDGSFQIVDQIPLAMKEMENDLSRKLCSIKCLESVLKPEFLCKFKIKEIPKNERISFKQLIQLGQFANLERIQNRSGVYAFIFDPKDKNEVLNQLDIFRKSKTENPVIGKPYAIVKLPTGAMNSTTTCLYLGSRKSDIKGRIMQHLGLGYSGTYAMHLNMWAPQELVFSLYFIPVDDAEFTELVEASMNMVMKPLIGKH